MTAAQLQAFRARAQAELEGMFPGVLRIGGQSVSCAMGGIRISGDLELGGPKYRPRVTARVSRAALAAAAIAVPKIGQPVIIDGQGEFRVDELADSASDPSLSLTLVAS